jgi:hypothetical protein
VTTGELTAALTGATATAAAPIIGVVDSGGGLVALAGGAAMWGATMLKSYLDHRERMVKFDADVDDLRKEAKRLSKLADEMADEVQVNRIWMREVAVKAGVSLPSGFGQRSYDKPPTGLSPIVHLGTDDDTPPRPKGE